jgi:hypothetical protein
MDGLVPGRIVYFVFNEQCAAEAMRRRTTAKAIADRMQAEVVRMPAHSEDTVVKAFAWPAGAQAHIGNDVKAGDICPAMVLRVWGDSGCSNLKVMLDGTDVYWATNINYDAQKAPYTWHWMFDGQASRYTPDRPNTPEPPQAPTPEPPPEPPAA